MLSITVTTKGSDVTGITLTHSNCKTTDQTQIGQQ